MQKRAIILRKKNNPDHEIAQAFRVHFDRVQIPLFDIPKIYEKARKSMALGFTADHAVKAILPEYVK